MRCNRAFLVLAIFLSVLSAGNGRQKPNKSEVLRTVYFDNVDMASVLHAFAADYDITIGLEADPEKPRSQITLNLSGANFSQILDGIVSVEPRYKWRDNNGHIDVLPVNGGLGLLDSRLEAFQLQDINRVMAANRLFGLPEIQALLRSKGLRPRPPNPPSDHIKDEKLSFDLRAVTLRQALHQIAHDSGANFWMFRSYPDHTFEISFW